MAKGRKTGGRQKGTPNKASAVKEAALAQTRITPLEFLLNIMRGTACPSDAAPEIKVAMVGMQFEAAKAAAPYVHPRAGSPPANPELPSPADAHDERQITYDIARRIAFALDVTPPKQLTHKKRDSV